MAPLFTWIPMPHLPTVPEHFIAEARRVARPKINHDEYSQIQKGYHTGTYLHRKITVKGNTVTTRHQQAFEMSPEWTQWCQENIFPNFRETTVRISVGDSDTHGAHVDKPGKIRLFYLIDRGSDSAETVFYHKPGKPVVYNMQDYQAADPIYELDHDQLIELERVQFPVAQWVLFNGCILHSVEKNIGARLNLTVDIDPSALQFHVIPNLKESINV